MTPLEKSLPTPTWAISLVRKSWS